MDELHEILRSHYGESDPSELYQELCSAVQKQKESAHEFLVRIMDLRQRVILASQKSAGIRYNETTVQDMYKHAIITGLSNDNIRNEISPLLQAGESDEVLMAKLVRVERVEQERQKKHGQSRKPGLKISMIDSEETKDIHHAKTSKPDKLEDFKSEVREMLKVGIQAISETVSYSSQHNMPRGDNRRGWSQRPKGCKACREDGVGDSCRHCWKCGAENHFAKGCRAPVSGNGRRSLSGDDE